MGVISQTVQGAMWSRLFAPVMTRAAVFCHLRTEHTQLSTGLTKRFQIFLGIGILEMEHILLQSIINT